MSANYNGNQIKLAAVYLFIYLLQATFAVSYVPRRHAPLAQTKRNSVDISTWGVIYHISGEPGGAAVHVAVGQYPCYCIRLSSKTRQFGPPLASCGVMIA